MDASKPLDQTLFLLYKSLTVAKLVCPYPALRNQARMKMQRAWRMGISWATKSSALLSLATVLFKPVKIHLKMSHTKLPYRSCWEAVPEPLTFQPKCIQDHLVPICPCASLLF